MFGWAFDFAALTRVNFPAYGFALFEIQIICSDKLTPEFRSTILKKRYIA